MEINTIDDYKAMLESGLSDVEKLARGFDWATGAMLAGFDQEVTMATALGDADGRVKAQIRASVLRTARRAFSDTYRQITGRAAFDDD